MNLDLLFVQRDGYTFIDVLSDIGGIEAILISFITFFLSFWNYKHFDSYMVEHLYKIGSMKEEDEALIEETKCENIKYVCMDWLPRKLVCCRKSK